MTQPSDRRPPAGPGAAPRRSPADRPLGRREYLRARDADLVTSETFPHSADRIYLIEIALTYGCQCRCEHCAVGRQTNRGTLLSADEIVDLCRQAKEDLGAKVVELFGGEPLLRDDIEAIVEGAARHLDVWLSTNGVAFTRELAHSLARRGLKLVIFSLDSVDPDTHDRIRGRAGCFDAVLRGLEYCAETGIVAHLSACVTPGALANGEVDRLIAFARQSKAQKLCLLPAKMAGRFADREDVLLSQAELAALWQRVVREDGRVYVETEANFSQNIGKCFCLRDWLYVNPYGVVQPCVYVFFDFGNVREHPLKFLWRRMFEHPIFRNKAAMNLCLMQNPRFVRRYFSDVSEDQPLVKVDFE